MIIKIFYLYYGPHQKQLLQILECLLIQVQQFWDQEYNGSCIQQYLPVPSREKEKKKLLNSYYIISLGIMLK